MNWDSALAFKKERAISVSIVANLAPGSLADQVRNFVAQGEFLYLAAMKPRRHY